ncbi:hypothetical protein [Mycobacterium sp. OTB74]|jgi:hypothetical protein|uniref:hypothetical protein n=1 Tax=Mycobacterium sp. OTB74 TaxID=1853452 RepID=UPI0024742925|nr:hypothetical protein [Mycobacterium sp. OTB74]MDH6243492.1 hypothetical protein [Mycobacterium sp. OTB74]
MGVLIGVAFWAGIGYLFYRRFKRQWNRNRTPGQKFELAPASAVAILGVIAIIPGLWILRVEGWTETWSTNLRTGQTTTTSTAGSQFAKAAIYFAIGFGLMFAAKMLAQRQVPWPPAILEQFERLGLISPKPANPTPTASGPSAAGAQGLPQFNTPPGWPTQPHGWTPPQGWAPDPAWPPAPEGWQFWSAERGRAN